MCIRDRTNVGAYVSDCTNLWSTLPQLQHNDVVMTVKFPFVLTVLRFKLLMYIVILRGLQYDEVHFSKRRLLFGNCFLGASEHDVGLLCIVDISIQ